MDYTPFIDHTYNEGEFIEDDMGEEDYDYNDDEDYGDDDDGPSWVDHFYNELYRMWNNSELPGYKWNDNISSSVLDTVVQSMMRYHIQHKIARDLDSEYNLLHTMNRILKLLYGQVETFSFPPWKSAWHVYFGIAVAWYECEMKVTLEDVVDFYCQYKGRRFDTGEVNYSLGYDGMEDDLRPEAEDVDEFWILFRTQVDTMALRREMWELWYQNDPAVNKEGIGNYTVWFPREIVEDIVQFFPIKMRLVEKEHDFVRYLRNFMAGMNIGN